MRQVGDCRVEGQVTFQEEACSLPFLGNHGKTVIHSVPGAVEVDQFPLEIDPARRPRPDAEHRFQQFRPAGADKPVQAENFAFPYVEGDILQVRLKFGGKVLNRKHHIAGLVVNRRKAVVQRTADHGGNQLVHVGFFGFFGQHHFAVPQNGNLIADLKNLVHFMGDIDVWRLP